MNKNSVFSIQYLLANEGGSALIITLLLVSILVGLVVDFVYEVYIDSSSLSNWSNAQRASLVARSGQVLSSRYLREIRKYSYTDVREALLPVTMDFGPDTTLVIKVEDENSRFNINSIIRQNGLTNEDALSSLKKLLEYLNINSDLALVIADWIDPDSEPRLTGSEDVAKNTFLWSVDELKLIEGMDQGTFDKISPYITVYGDGKININTADLPVIVSLHKDITETLAKRIIDYRKDTPFEEPSYVQRVSGMEATGMLLIGRIESKSSYFRVISMAKVDEISRVIESVMDTSGNIYFWREG
ncbi:MAG: type II secretion system minor pseudopilin GspK [Deferribacteres bacterium]|nr:type II secretion system minor pseudopilin GspK [Deferribacteres bacterium]